MLLYAFPKGGKALFLFSHCRNRGIDYNTGFMKLYSEALLRLLYPSSCGVCHSFLGLEEQGICHTCRSECDTLRFSFHQTPFNHSLSWVDEAWTLYPYESPIREILTEVKFSKKRWLMNIFEKDIQSFCESLKGETHYDILIPVPLDHQKRMEREFNQAELLAHLMSKSIQIPVQTRWLKKRRTLFAQSELSRRERLIHVRDIFKINFAEGLKGKRVLLVDDILTTGTTAEEAARTLKKHGAKSVDVFALARTLAGGESA